MTTTRQLFLQYQAQTSEFPLLLEIERAEGIHMFDREGKRYIDLISGIGVSSVGHCHPNILRAIHDQTEKYLHLMVYGEFVQTPQVDLAVELSASLPSGLNSSYFVNSGSEAVEGALKLSKRFTGRSGLVFCENSYHGSTHGALSVTGSEAYKRAFRPLLPGASAIRFGEIQDLEHITDSTAAFIVETIQGEAGVRTGSADYWQAVRNKCTDTGTLLILDEIQVGFGRTGKMWAFEHYGIEPDIVVCAKGMGGGMPIGAFISSRKIMSVLKVNPILGHITTFGGHPVSCAASLATLRTILGDRLMDNIDDKANQFKLALSHPSIKEIRNKGLIMAVEFESFEILKSIIDKALSKGVLTDWFLNCDNSLRIAPPLIITSEQIQEASEILMESIREVLD